MKNSTSKQIHLFTVSNDVSGREQITKLRKQMKESGSPLRIVLYGRGYRHGKGRMHVCKCNQSAPTGPRSCGCRWFDNSYQSSLPLPLSQKIAVFVTGRGKPSFD